MFIFVTDFYVKQLIQTAIGFLYGKRIFDCNATAEKTQAFVFRKIFCILTSRNHWKRKKCLRISAHYYISSSTFEEANKYVRWCIFNYVDDTIILWSISKI